MPPQPDQAMTTAHATTTAPAHLCADGDDLHHLRLLPVGKASSVVTAVLTMIAQRFTKPRPPVRGWR
jgi:hypothetical protein